MLSAIGTLLIVMSLFTRIFGALNSDEQRAINQFVRAVDTGKVDAVRDLLKTGISPDTRDADNIPVLVIAVSAQQQECVKILLKAGADPRIRVTNSKRAFQNAPAVQFPAANGNAAILQSLIEGGADIEAADDTGLRPLMSAAFMGNVDALKLLLKSGAAVDAKDGIGYTALMFAANAGRAECVRTLLDHKADPNAKDEQHSTPIMFAAQHGHNACIRLLLASGADPKTKGTHGLSAIDFARQNNLKETESILTTK